MAGEPLLMVMRTRNPLMRAIQALAPAKATVFVIRHGSTDRNRGGVGMDQVRGHADIPMTEGGEREVRVTAYILAAERIGVIHCSDLDRASRTSEILSDENVGYPAILPTPLLRSWDMGGGMEGKVTTPDVVAQIREWVRDDTVVPAGGESFRAFANRLLGYVGPLFAQAARDGNTVAVVAHGRCAQVIDFWVAAGCDEECMHRDFAEYLAEEPDTVPPGGGIRYKHDGIGWEGQVIPTGEPSLGTQIAAGAYIRPRNDLVAEQNGLPPS
jgi:broad specificity phosphatase PhoE